MSITATLEQEKATGIQFANELRESVVAIELRKQAIGKTRVLTNNQRVEVSQHFGADYHSVNTSKRLFDPAEPRIKRINGILNDARACWVNLTISYTKGIRLIRKEQLSYFVKQFDSLQSELNSALADADLHYDAILESSRRYLNDKLFNPRDYPAKFSGSVSIAWSIHNFEPSEELLRLAPETYKREQERVRRQFESAIATYELEAREQLASLCDSLLNSLSEPKEGKRQVFKEATANNLRLFFERFRTINITSDSQLNELIAEAESALGNQTMGTLKRNSFRRETTKEKFTAIKERLTTLIEDAPIRSIDFGELED